MSTSINIVDTVNAVDVVNEQNNNDGNKNDATKTETNINYCLLFPTYATKHITEGII